MKEKTITPWEFDLHEAERKGYGTVRLLIDGYNVSYEFQRANKNNLVFMFCVDGQFKGRWTEKYSEIGKRFGRPLRVRMAKPTIKMLGYNYSKKEVLEKVKEHNERIRAYTPIHNSAKTLIASLKKNNLSIELNTK